MRVVMKCNMCQSKVAQRATGMCLKCETDMQGKVSQEKIKSMSIEMVDRFTNEVQGLVDSYGCELQVSQLIGILELIKADIIQKARDL